MPIPIKRFKSPNNPMYKKYKAIRKARKAKPNRFKGSKVSSRYTTTRLVSKMLSNYGENKFRGNLIECQESVPKSSLGGTQPLSYNLINLGRDISTFLGVGWTHPMNLYQFPLGDASFERTGRYMYLRKTHLTMEIQMNPINDTSQVFNNLNNQLQFRLMLVKANRKYQPYGEDSSGTARPNTSLFLTNQNTAFGITNTTASTFEYMNNPINRRQFNVLCDKKFTLSPPAVCWDNDEKGAINAANSRFPTKRTLHMNIPYYRKAFFQNSDTATQNTPTNLDTQCMIILQAVRSSYCADPITTPLDTLYTLTVQGTTTCRDS